MNHLARLMSAAAVLWPAVLVANIAPTVVIQSASMRGGTTFMDVVYRVDDPDDATVKTRALAFIEGVRSFEHVIKPVTFVEGTAAKLGDAIATNTNHTLAWDIAADLDTDLSQVKFEILAMDGRGLLPIDWITIPAANGNPALTISKDTFADDSVLNAFFWQYADGDPGLTLSNGVVTGNASSGNFSGLNLVSGNAIQTYAPAFILKRMNLDPASDTEVKYAAETARAGLTATSNWHAANRVYSGVSVVVSWGKLGGVPAEMTRNVASIAAGGDHFLAIKDDGTVVGSGYNYYGETTIPAGLANVSAIAAGGNHSLALRNDGTVVAWGRNSHGQTTIPEGLTNVVAIAAGQNHSIALKNDGTIVDWGYGSETIPNGLTNVVAIASGGSYNGVIPGNHRLALKDDGTVVGWGPFNWSGASTIPDGLTNVAAIAAGDYHSLALKDDSTIVGWGSNHFGETNIPAGLTNVVAIAAGSYHNLALKDDGTVVGWGGNDNGETTIPSGASKATAIAAGDRHSLALKVKAL